jgi:glycosyltransferase
VDGGSTDGTLDVIRENDTRIAKWISGPDQGIYDAMNKGISLATGEVIGILNADDFYANPHVVSKVASVFHDDRVCSCYGDLEYVDSEDTFRVVRYWRSGHYKVKSFYWGWMPPHPTFFVRRDIYEKYGLYNLTLGSAADYELMLRFLLKYRITTAYIPEVLVRMRRGGTSNASLRNRLSAHLMDRAAWSMNGIKPYPWTLFLKPLRKVGQFLPNHKAVISR